MYDDILYPTDGSEGSMAALDGVRDLAETYEATVHVLYVAEASETHGLAGDTEVTGTGGFGSGSGKTSSLMPERTRSEERKEKTREYGAALVGQVADQLDDVSTRTEVRGGVPHEVILDYADTHGIDLVVMGTHGRTGLDRYVVGSVAERVVRMSDVPVMTVRGSKEA
jgi:nucleotide-binding universal stress UspA family protein